MINLPQDIYKNVEDEYFDFIYPCITQNIIQMKKKVNKSDSISHCILNQDALFFKTLLINPFSSESRKNYPFLNDYYEVMKLLLQSTKYFKKIYEADKEAGIISDDKKKSYYKCYRYKAIKNNKNNSLIKQILQNNYPRYYQTQKGYDELHREIKEEMRSLNKMLSEIFNYDLINSEWRVRILTETNINICPYCNRQYINSFIFDDKKRTIAQLDHFYPKAHFPLYTLTLNNFIPSCAHCNTALKKDKYQLLNYPINSKGNEKDYFSINYKSVGALLGLTDDFDIELNDKAFDYTELMTAQNFVIGANYNGFHKKDVHLQLKQSNLYNDSYKSIIEKNLSMNFSKEEFAQLIFNYTGEENEIFNKPLSKLIHDVIDFEYLK